MAESDKIVNDAVDSRLNLPLPFGFLNSSAHTEKGHKQYYYYCERDRFKSLQNLNFEFPIIHAKCPIVHALKFYDTHAKQFVVNFPSLSV